MNQQVSIEVERADGARVRAEVDYGYQHAEAHYTLHVAGIELRSRTSQSEDLFEAMRAQRLVLERQGAKLLCAGARLDAYPSSMSRAGGARRVYVNKKLGESATEHVDLFEYAPPELVGSIREQDAFQQRSAASMARR